MEAATATTTGDNAPTLTVASVVHHGCVNRVRCLPQKPNTVATWSDSGHVMIWDLSAHGIKVMTSTKDAKGKVDPPQRVTPTQVFTGHKDEGYAIDWSPVCEEDWRAVIAPERFTPRGIEGKWDAGATPSLGTRRAWRTSSGLRANATSSCRAPPTKPCACGTRACAQARAASQDDDAGVNVMSWNRLANCMVATGADDGSLRIWDLRNFNESNPQFVANFTFHRAPVTSVDWAPFVPAMLASSSADNTVCVWD